MWQWFSGHVLLVTHHWEDSTGLGLSSQMFTSPCSEEQDKECPGQTVSGFEDLLMQADQQKRVFTNLCYFSRYHKAWWLKGPCTADRAHSHLAGMVGEIDIYVALTAELKYNMVLAVLWGIGKWPQWQYDCLLQVRRKWSLHVYTMSGRNRTDMYIQCFNCLMEKVNKLSESWPDFRSSEVWFRKSCSHWSKVYKSSPDFLRL